MSRSLLVLMICIHSFSFNAVYASSFVDVADLKLTGEPQSLLSIEKISIDGHEIAMHRWSGQGSLFEVMHSLAAQVPFNTIAWSDDDVMRMHWTSAGRSNMLIFYPSGQDRIDFLLSSLQSKKYLQDKNTPTKALSVNTARSYEIEETIENIFHELKIKNERLMDVRDESAETISRSLLFVLAYPLDRLEDLLRKTLRKNSWSLSDSPSRKEKQSQARSMTAVQSDKILYMNLVQYLGRSYLHINFSGLTKP